MHYLESRSLLRVPLLCCRGEARRDATKVVGYALENAELRGMIAEEILNAEIAQMIYDARTQAGLTQKQLAELIGTKQLVIARLEDADYEGHSLAMLHRIAAALGQRLVVKMVASKLRRRAATTQKRQRTVA